MKWALIIGLPVIVLAAAWLALVVKAWRAESRIRWVRKHGRPVSTEFQAVIRGKVGPGGGEQPYRIVTRWRRPATGIYYTFESGDVPFDPQTFAGTRPIIVRINPRNPRWYVMDTSFLPDSPEPQRGGPDGASVPIRR